MELHELHRLMSSRYRLGGIGRRRALPRSGELLDAAGLSDAKTVGVREARQSPYLDSGSPPASLWTPNSGRLLYAWSCLDRRWTASPSVTLF